MIITPNQLTIFRIFLAVVIPFLVLIEKSFLWDFIAMLGFTAAIVTDWYDGKIAREKGLISDFGKIADPIADKLLILGLFGTFVYLKLYSVWWVLVIFFREIVVTFTRLVLLGQGKVIPAEQAGKLKVGFQIGSIYASFLFLMARGTGFVLEPFFSFLNILGIVLANLLTIYSGLLFFFNLFQVRTRRIAYFISTSAFIGKIPFAPGTWGSLAGVLILLFVNGNTFLFFGTLVLLAVVGIWAADRASQMLGNPDPACIVIDETCGMLVSFILVPVNWLTVLLGFAFFRFFDIAKPLGIRAIERKFKGGLGIMLDDIVAGIFSNVLLHAILLWTRAS